jgi:alpha-L-rhamnosidase
VNTTGFIALSVRALTDTELYLTFDEILTEGEVDFTRNSTSNVSLYKLKGSVDYHLVTMAPYTFKYINVISVGGRAEVSYLGMIRTDFNASEITRELDKSRADDVTERIYGAAIETFRQNTFDIFMDCPSRERAGWLCDSFFTARVERLLTGKNTVERCFLSNFLMEENYKGIPSGMLPMCYPSEFRTPEYIPNWAMWYLLELREYEKRTKDGALVSAAEGKMRALCAYFEKYENSDGLLEGLDGWVFVEWSMCNKLVQDVNYPSNMLYCMFLKTMYELYGDEKYLKKASSLRELIRQRSRMGLFFCDNSVRRDGVLTLSGECTETCQYYAFFTGVATPEEDSELWQTMVRDFGPGRAESGLWANIHPSNAFIGNYLRLELLAKNKIYDKLEADIRGYFDYMAKRTGTLWEHTNVNASCNHGFASHVLVWLDMLGYII